MKSRRKNQVRSLTPKQKEVLDFITAFSEKNGYSPSLVEIANHFKKSPPTIHQFIQVLKDKGYIHKIDNVSRGIEPSSHEAEVFKLGYIAAGEPIEPIENPELIKAPVDMVRGSGQFYALEVRGDSMIEEGIMDGDTIVIRHQNTADDRDIVVAITENGATLKRLRKSDRVYLEPRNKKLKNIYPKKLEIRGKFFGLIRKYA